MEISVIIPSYKPDNYIFKCLDSLLLQTFDKAKFEVIVVLNGCDEPYSTMITSYIKKNPSINWLFLKTETAGVSNARNIALDNAHGKYITFIDDDDYVSPSFLSDMYEKASEDSIVFACPQHFNIVDDSHIKSKNESVFHNNMTKNAKISINGIRSLLSGPCAKLIPKDNVIGERRFYRNLSLGEDTMFMFLISDRIRYFNLSSPSAIYFRSIRPNSAAHMQRSLSFLIENCIKQLRGYTSIYFKRPFKYNFFFYITRCAGAIYGPIKKSLRYK